jgi:hypothetical protein
MPDVVRGKRVAGTLLAFLVDDVDGEEARLRREELEIVLPLVTEPWGQRRLQVTGPDGLVVEVLQAVDPSPEWLRSRGCRAGWSFSSRGRCRRGRASCSGRPPPGSAPAASHPG